MKKLLLLVLCSFILVSCAPAPSIEDPVIEEEKIDLGGAAFLFAVAGGGPSEYFPEVGNSSSGDKILARYTQMELDLNCTLTMHTINDKYSAGELFASAAAETDVPDISDSQVTVAYQLFQSDMLTPLESVIDITDEDKYGPHNYIANGNFNGTFYGFAPYAWERLPEIYGVIMINNPLIKALNMANPYEIKEKGEWTWDGFEEQLKLGTITDGEIKYSGLLLYSGGGVINDYMITAAFSNGAQILYNNNGATQFGFTDDAALAGFEYGAKLNTEGYIKQIDPCDGFINNEGPYFFCRSHMGLNKFVETDIQYLMDEFGFMPFPIGPAADKDTCSSYISTNRLIYILSISENEIENIGHMVDYVFAPLDDTGGWKELSKAQMFHHPEDFVNFVEMVENVKYVYNVPLGDAYKRFETELQKMYNSKVTPAASMKSVEEIINTQVIEGGIVVE